MNVKYKHKIPRDKGSKNHKTSVKVVLDFLFSIVIELNPKTFKRINLFRVYSRTKFEDIFNVREMNSNW
jgi:hypothetical protein